MERRLHSHTLFSHGRQLDQGDKLESAAVVTRDEKSHRACLEREGFTCR